MAAKKRHVQQIPLPELDTGTELAIHARPLPSSPHPSVPSFPSAQLTYGDGIVYAPDAFTEAFLTLSHVRGIGIATLRNIVAHTADITTLFERTVDDVAHLLTQAQVKESYRLAHDLINGQRSLRERAKQTHALLDHLGVSLIGWQDARFPVRLRSIPDGPRWIFAEGDLRALHAPLIGIVGTRKPSSEGIRAAERLTSVICREGFGIVSGLAEGIDASAHRVGLYYQVPQVAVLGTGIDITFPASTRSIRERMIKTNGVVISEYLLGDSYSKANFVLRNRLQAALALALAPVESTEQSGTSHTVRYAEQYRRPLFGIIRGKHAASNAMPARLSANHHPIFDLDRAEDIGRLIDWLHTVVPFELWPDTPGTYNARAFFASILQQIDELQVDTPIGERDLAWLCAEITQRVRRTSLPASGDIL